MIVDLGHSFFKIGYAGDSAPRIDTESCYAVCFPNSRPGEEIDPNTGKLVPTKNKFIFMEQLHNYNQNCQYKPILKPGCEYPEKEFSEFFCEEVFGSLNIEPKTMPVMMSEDNMLTKEDRLKYVHLMLEGNVTQSFFMLRKSVLSLYACGKLSGTILDSGSYLTSTSTIEEGYFVPEGYCKLNFGGEHITEKIMQHFEHEYASILPDSIRTDGTNDLHYLDDSVFHFERRCFSRKVKHSLLSEECSLIT